MNLLDKIKKAREKGKASIGVNSLNTVIAIIEAYSLDSNFLRFLDASPYLIVERKNTGSRFTRKPDLRIPIFPLTSRRNYLLAKQVIEAIGNPYIRFSRAPEELYLSKFLYRENPSISHDELRNYHFEILLRREIDKKKSKNRFQ